MSAYDILIFSSLTFLYELINSCHIIKNYMCVIAIKEMDSIHLIGHNYLSFLWFRDFFFAKIKNKILQKKNIKNFKYQLSLSEDCAVIVLYAFAVD